jgi:hypothetical protein
MSIKVTKKDAKNASPCDVPASNICKIPIKWQIKDDSECCACPSEILQTLCLPLDASDKTSAIQASFQAATKLASYIIPAKVESKGKDEYLVTLRGVSKNFSHAFANIESCGCGACTVSISMMVNAAPSKSHQHCVSAGYALFSDLCNAPCGEESVHQNPSSE